MTVEEALEILSVYVLSVSMKDKPSLEAVLRAVYEHGKAKGREEKERER